MAEPNQAPDDRQLLERALGVTVHLGTLALLAAWCFAILRPFVSPIVWGVIIAVAAYPGYRWVLAGCGGRQPVAAAVFVLVALLVLIAPTVLLSETLVTGARDLADALNDGTLAVPPPPAGIAEWPLIGEPIATFWGLASENLQAALGQLEPQLKAMSLRLLAVAANVGLAILQFILAIVIAAVLLAHAEGGYQVARRITLRLSRERGEAIANIAESTVRSVARGILGVALIQALLAGIGFHVVGIPGAGLWALLCLILSVIQIGPTPILAGAVIYVFSAASTTVAVVFLVWCVLVGLIDNVLKPLLLGRGVDVPMIIIFMGAIGGFISMGLVGLFVGSVVVVLGYTLVVAWLDPRRDAVEAPAVAARGPAE